MTDLRVITSEGADAILEEAAVHDFAGESAGPAAAPRRRAAMTTPAKSGTA